MKVPRPDSHDWRDFPDNESRIHPQVAARDAIRESDHVSAADAYLLEAAFERGQAERDRALRAADISATLALRDALSEATSALKAIAVAQIESVAELNGTVKHATNALITEVRQATIREVA